MKTTTKPRAKKSKFAPVFDAIDKIAIRVFSALINHINCPDADDCARIIEVMHAITGGGKAGGANGWWVGGDYVKSPRLYFEVEGFKISVIDDAKALYSAWLKLTAKKGVTTYHNPKPTPLPSANAAAIELAEGYLLDAFGSFNAPMSYDFESLQSLNDIAPNVLCLISTSKVGLLLGIKTKTGAYYLRYKNDGFNDLDTFERVHIDAATGSVADFIASKLEPITVLEVSPALVEPVTVLGVATAPAIECEQAASPAKIDGFTLDIGKAPVRLDHGVLSMPNRLKNLDRDIDRNLEIIAKNERRELDDRKFLHDEKNGTLKQWRKFPDHFFVEGVDKGRIIIKNGVAYHKYLGDVPKEQYPKFRDTYNAINKALKTAPTYHFAPQSALSVRNDVLRLLSVAKIQQVKTMPLKSPLQIKLEKELNKLNREVNSRKFLVSFGDETEEQAAQRRLFRQAKINHRDEVLKVLNELTAPVSTVAKPLDDALTVRDDALPCFGDLCTDKITGEFIIIHGAIGAEIGSDRIAQYDAKNNEFKRFCFVVDVELFERLSPRDDLHLKQTPPVFMTKADKRHAQKRARHARDMAQIRDWNEEAAQKKENTDLICVEIMPFHVCTTTPEEFGALYKMLNDDAAIINSVDVSAPAKPSTLNGFDIAETITQLTSIAPQQEVKNECNNSMVSNGNVGTNAAPVISNSNSKAGQISIQSPNKTSPIQLSKVARAGIMILGWFFARELFNAAGQVKIREFLSSGLKMAWNFDALTVTDFARFFAQCTDDTKAAKVYALYTSITAQQLSLEELRRLSDTIELKKDKFVFSAKTNCTKLNFLVH